MFSNEIDISWEEDSVFFFSSDEIPIQFEWEEDFNTNHIIERFFFFQPSTDDIAYEQEVRKKYYIDFMSNGMIDRDTLTIRFMAKKVECGQILDPLVFEFNGNQVEPYISGVNSKINLVK